MPIQITKFNAAYCVNAICKLVGYPTSASPLGSTDTKHVQMVAALTEANAEMLALHEWQDLIKQWLMTISGTGGEIQLDYPLPDDFYRFVDQTQWQAPAGFGPSGGEPGPFAPIPLQPANGPVSSQGWMTSLAWGGAAPFTLNWQIRGDRIWFRNPPVAPGTGFTFFYISRAMVIDETDPTMRKNEITKDGDTFVLDAYTLVLLARKKWLEWNSMDSTAATADFNTVFNSRVGSDKGAPVLSISRGGMTQPLLSVCNVPQTGFGS